VVVLICPIRLHLPVHVNSWVHTGGGYADTELAVTLGCARLKIRKHDVNGTVGLVLREIKLFKNPSRSGWYNAYTFERKIIVRVLIYNNNLKTIIHNKI
jgi:hypothetical protein